MVRVKAKAKVSEEAERGPCAPLRSLPPHTAVCILSSQGGIWRGTGFKLLQGQSDRKPGGGSGEGSLFYTALTADPEQWPPQLHKSGSQGGAEVPRPAPRVWVGQRSIRPSGPPLPAPTSPYSVTSPHGEGLSVNHPEQARCHQTEGRRPWSRGDNLVHISQQ